MLRKVLLVLLMLMLPLNAGCENKRELNEIAIVLGVGVDIGEKDSVAMSVQVVKPGDMQSGGGGGGTGGGGKGGGAPYIVETREGSTLFDAIRNFSMINGKKLFFSHNQVIIFGEDVIKKGIGPYVDFLERDTELRSEVPVLVGKGKALDYLNLPPVMAKIPSEEIDNAINLSSVTGKSVPYHLTELAIALREEDVIPVPQIEIIEENKRKQFQIEGMAILKGEEAKLAGWLTPTETRGLLWGKGEVKGGIIVIHRKNVRIALEIKEAKGKITVEMRDDKPVYKIEVEETSDIGEVMGSHKVSKETVDEVNQLQKAAIISEIKKALEKSQKDLKTDIFGFSSVLHRHHPQYWDTIKDKWDIEYPAIGVEISVKTRIKNSAELTHPPIIGD